MLRSGLAALGAMLLTAAATAGAARADALADLAAAAAKKEPVVWYESSSPEAMDLVIAAFNKRYPDIRIKFQQFPGGNQIAARVIQETQARGVSASILTSGSQQVGPLLQRNLLLSRNWNELGVEPKLAPSPYGIMVAASMFVSLWNKTKVKDDQAPRTWDDFTDPRWTGKVGTWVRTPGFTSLAYDFGEERVRDLIEKFGRLKPFLYTTPDFVAQNVATGEIDVGIGIYHAAMPVISAGAPVGMRFMEPMPVNTIWALVPTSGANVEGGQVLAAWLATPEGAIAYENGTKRGNPLIKGTRAAEFAGVQKLIDWPITELATNLRLDEIFSKRLSDLVAGH